MPIAGDLGDQQAATFGQTCFAPGEAKNTYGTGNFLLLNTGTEAVPSKSGLLTTVGYKIGDQDAIYCLEGSIAITGALVQWLRDNLKMIKAAPEVEELAKSVDDNGGCYIVPAFSGLFAPYWKSNARGVIAGLTRYVNAGHIARATLEATAYQSREVVEAMDADSGVALESLKVDGGMVGNDLLMQFQADLLGVPVIRPQVPETTSLGAAYAAGLATGFWSEVEDLRENWAEDKRWEPTMDSDKRDEYYKYWKRAVTRTFDWFDADEEPDEGGAARAAPDDLHVQTSCPDPDRNLALELVRATEAAAIAAARFMGRGDKERVDQAAVDAMRPVLRSVAMDGVVRDRRGREGRGADALQRRARRQRRPARPSTSPSTRVDGTTLDREGAARTRSPCSALAERGTMFDPGPCVYMEKLAGGARTSPTWSTSRPPIGRQPRADREGARQAAGDVTVAILDRAAPPGARRARCSRPARGSSSCSTATSRARSWRPTRTRRSTCWSVSAARPRA